MASWRMARPNDGTILTPEDQSRLNERVAIGRGSGHGQHRVTRMTKIETIRHGAWRGGWAPPSADSQATDVLDSGRAGPSSRLYNCPARNRADPGSFAPADGLATTVRSATARAHRRSWDGRKGRTIT